MGLDVYVMPIWKFKAGDFASPLERLGILPFIVGPHGTKQRNTGAGPGLIAGWKAKRATRQLRREIEAKIGHRVRWNDDGDVAYAEQAPGFEPLRAFAKWLDCRDLFPAFDPPPEDDYCRHPAMLAELTRPLTYPQVVTHCCFAGYYLPTDLERIVHVDPYSSWGGRIFHRSVGSSRRLREELRQLSGILGIDDQYEWDDGDPLAAVKATFAQLYQVAKISCRWDLPIVFYG